MNTELFRLLLWCLDDIERAKTYGRDPVSIAEQLADVLESVYVKDMSEEEAVAQLRERRTAGWQ